MKGSSVSADVSELTSAVSILQSQHSRSLPSVFHRTSPDIQQMQFEPDMHDKPICCVMISKTTARQYVQGVQVIQQIMLVLTLQLLTDEELLGVGAG